MTRPVGRAAAAGGHTALSAPQPDALRYPHLGRTRLAHLDELISLSAPRLVAFRYPHLARARSGVRTHRTHNETSARSENKAKNRAAATAYPECLPEIPIAYPTISQDLRARASGLRSPTDDPQLRPATRGSGDEEIPPPTKQPRLEASARLRRIRCPGSRSTKSSFPAVVRGEAGPQIHLRR